ncbi:protease/ABC transporter B family protein tagA (Partial), partial [Seminavis robusta]
HEAPIKGVQAVFCRGGSKLTRETLLGSLTNEDRRSRRLEEFLQSRNTRHNDSEPRLHRRLEGFADESCMEMVSKVGFSVPTDGEDFATITFPDDARSQFPQQCSYSLLIDLALHAEVCFIGALLHVKPRNSVASGIIQSGDKDDKPFHEVGLDGRDQIVAISDSGLDVDHCYFWDPDKSVPRDTSKTFDPSPRKVVQYLAYADSQDVAGGHGTHVAATLAGHRAVDGRSESDDGENGVAKAAKIAFFDIGNSVYNTLQLPPNVFDIFSTGYDVNARVHTASWGSDTNYYTSLDQAVDAYISKHPDFLLVVAAGNLGDLGLHTVGTPAISKNALAVGATESTQPRIPVHMKGPDYLANFSSRGPTADLRMKPDVCAPGIYLKSAKANPDEVGECDDTDGLELRSGTSMAAPVVAGAATLIRQYFMEGWLAEGRRNPAEGFHPRASLLKAVLINGAQELLGVEDAPNLISETHAYDAHQGFGRVELIKSLPIAGKNNFNAKVVNAQSIGNHGKDEYVLQIDKTDSCNEPLSITLVWTDPIVSPFCMQCTVNDLDLYVTSTNNPKRIFPNGLSQADTLNNAERIRVDDPREGDTYTIHVEAKDLVSTQDYSLVVSGCFKEVEETAIVPTCRDSGGDVVVSDTEVESCFWLARNFDDFGSLCELIDVASRCQQTCNFCDKLLLPTTFDAPGPSLYAEVGNFEGAFRWDGIMFEVSAEEDLLITSLDIHTWLSTNYTVQVKTRASETEDWTTVCDTRVTGQGQGLSTRIPAKAFTQVEVAAGQRQTLYVTLDTPELVMEPTPSAREDITFSNPELKVGMGRAVTYSTGKAYPGYTWNGKVRYKLKSTVNAERPQCDDKAGDITIDPFVGTKPCSWLAEHMYHYRHVCSYVEQSTHCPRTCGVCYIVSP